MLKVLEEVGKLFDHWFKDEAWVSLDGTCTALHHGAKLRRTRLKMTSCSFRRSRALSCS